MPRVLTAHLPMPEPTLSDLIITALDDPPKGAESSNHQYSICSPGGKEASFRTTIEFQNGTLPHAGINGVTMEALLAIIADRLQGFQKGSYACRENALALTHCEEALNWLHNRTLKRMRRGVEGKNLV